MSEVPLWQGPSMGVRDASLQTLSVSRSLSLALFHSYTHPPTHTHTHDREGWWQQGPSMGGRDVSVQTAGAFDGAANLGSEIGRFGLTVAPPNRGRRWGCGT